MDLDGLRGDEERLGDVAVRVAGRREVGDALLGGRERVDARERLRARSRSELYAAGARPRSDALSGPASLTASERRVVDLAVTGETNRDIAQTLYVTPKTVEVHLSNAYRKLGIRSRRELAGVLAA